ncbi:MAG: TraB/GumN family protein [Bacteroidetes bacterium]|jgi:uncharacterized protein YbaP (TraB family)|nr:TraB/GumN family protein [Bacteroidota bacterium]
MLNFLFYLLLWIGLPLSAIDNPPHPQPNAQVEHAQLEKDTLAHALLWKISHSELEEPSYLFGTIHMIKKEDYFLPQGLLTAIDQTEEMVFEIDMAAMSDMSQMMGMMSQITMKGDTTLKTLLSPQNYEVVTDFFKEKGLPIFFLEKIKPMFLSAMVGMDGEIPSGTNDMTDLRNAFGKNMKSYEFELNSIAESANKSVSGLETIDFQMSLFDQISYQDQAKYLVRSIKQTNEGGGMEEGIFEMYKSMNINKMAESLSTEEDIEGMEDALLTERNVNWIPLIEEQIKQNPTLFAVGAGHLGGENGVIRLLRSEGYTLTPILAD